MLREKVNSRESTASMDAQPCRRRGKRDLRHKGQDPAEAAAPVKLTLQLGKQRRWPSPQFAWGMLPVAACKFLSKPER